jgi:hypothetical protein
MSEWGCSAGRLWAKQTAEKLHREDAQATRRVEVVGVTVLHHLEAQLGLDALDAASVKRDEPEPGEVLDRVGDRTAAEKGRLGYGFVGQAQGLAGPVQHEQEGFEDAQGGAADRAA